MIDYSCFRESGIRYYDASTPSLSRSPIIHGPNQPPYIVVGLKVLTNTVISNTSVFADGYDGDSAIFGKTLIPGDYPFLFESLVITSGTGYCLLG